MAVVDVVGFVSVVCRSADGLGWVVDRRRFVGGL